MKDLSDVTFMVVDTGLFLPMAHRLAEGCKRVLYWNPDQRAWPSLKQGIIGDGFADIERVSDLWEEFDEVDCFAFPDVGHSGLQQHLVDCGKLVWGSGAGDCYELDRVYFLETLAEVGLDVPPYKVIIGVTNLQEYLVGRTDQYVKVSKWRGDFETTHWRDWTKDKGWLDWLAVNFGSLKEQVEFLVFDNIETDLEIGGDTYCVSGRWPDYMLNGIEWKDKSYFAAVTRRSEMPDQLQVVLDKFGPLLGQFHYRNQWSMEVRVKGDKAYFIDATCRGGMPSTASQHKLWRNFPEIVYYGAAGELVEPDPTGMFSIECMVTSKTGKDTYDEVDIPEEIKEWTRLSSCCLVDGVYCFPPDEHHTGELGWLCAVGDTPSDTLAKIKELADQLPDGLDADVESMAGVIKEIDSAKEQGIPFTDQKMPPAASVIED